MDEGSTVTVTVCQGAEKVNMPNVVGQAEADAQRLLESLGFEVAVNRQPGAVEEEGKVVSQAPAPDTPLDAGSIVTVTVAEGTTSTTAPTPATVVVSPTTAPDPVTVTIP